MSTESHNTGQAPRHTDVAFEERDIKVGPIYGYLLALAAATIAALVICVYILRLTADFTSTTDAPPPPSRISHQKELPPEPRLQGFGFPGQQADPQADLRKKIREDMEANEKLEWVDRSGGIVQIPVKDAMKIIVEKGLPGASAQPAEIKK
jgi:hypothetical protein